MSYLEKMHDAARVVAGDDARDAARYRWLRDAKGLTLHSNGGKWTRPDGTVFFASHSLAANGTQYSASPTLDELIDSAIKTDEK